MSAPSFRAPVSAGAALYALALAFATHPAAARQADGHALTARLDTLVEAEFGARPSAGMQVLVVQGADTLYHRSLGHADLEMDVPLGAAAIFQIASVTKQFTAAAILRLVEDGRVELDADVRQYLPALDTHGAEVRMRQLLNHTGGVPNIYDMTSWPRLRPLRLLREEMRPLEWGGVAEDGLDFPPGTDWRYSNTGYDLLGDVIEAVTGAGVEAYFRTALFEPVGMHETSLCPWSRVIPGRARGYEQDSAGTGLVNARLQTQAVLFTSGGICSTARDLARWNAALHGGKILEADSYGAMTTPEGAARTYGYGLYRAPLEGHMRFRHNGYTPGFSAQLEYFPDDDLTIVVLTNSPAAVQGLAEAMARVVLGLPVDAGIQPGALPVPRAPA